MGRRRSRSRRGRSRTGRRRTRRGGGRTASGRGAGPGARRALLWGGGAFLALALLLAVAWSTCGFQGCPDPTRLGDYRPGGGPVLLDRNGEEIGRLHPLERDAVALDSLPEHVPEAFIAVEDRRFMGHRGVDWVRVAGAAYRNLVSRRLAEGASTLTMQLARSTFPEEIPGDQRTLRRKLLEVRVARDIERRFEKEEILELYLNHIYLGAGAYGVEAAARHYFDRPAAELGPQHAALLAALARSPGFYDPRRHPDRAAERRDLVLGLMERQGRLPEERARGARAQALAVVPDPPARRPPSEAPFFAEAVRGFLEERFADDLYRSRLRVHTTLDLEVHRAAEEALADGLARAERHPATAPGAEEGDLEGALVAMDPATGDIRALVGGRSFARSRFDRALGANRQLGSAFKPFVLAAALEEGYPPTQPVADRPFRVERTGSEPWAPRNYDGTYRGPVSFREILVESLNVPTARLGLAVGLERVGETAGRAGIDLGGDRAPAAALGTVSLSPLEATTAYATLASGGLRPEPRLVERVEWEDGTVLYESEPESRRVLDEGVAYILGDVLADVVDRGTGTAVRDAGYRGPAAGKTGTTQDARDAWFAGFTDRFAATVWIGYDEPRPIRPGATGGTLAAPVWGAWARDAHGPGPFADGPLLDRPAGVVEREVDLASGRIVEDGCGDPEAGTRAELFLVDALAEGTCPESRNVLRRIVDRFRSGNDDDEGDEGPAPTLDPAAAPGPVTPTDPVEDLLGTERLETRGGEPDASAGDAREGLFQ